MASVRRRKIPSKPITARPELSKRLVAGSGMAIAPEIVSAPLAIAPVLAAAGPKSPGKVAV
jgi:hypothetical protein